MSKPDGWEISSRHLAKQRKAGLDKVLRILKELEEVGLLQRSQHNDPETGHFCWYSILYEVPQLNPDYQTSTALPHTENPYTENPCMENPRVGYPYMVNPYESNTESANTESANTESTKNLEEEEGPTQADPLFAHLSGLMQRNIGVVSPLQYQDMGETVDELRNVGGDEAWLDQAVKIALDRNKRSWAYVRTVLDNAIKAGIPPDEYGRRLKQKPRSNKASSTHKPDHNPPKLLDLTEVYADELARLDEEWESNPRRTESALSQAEPDGGDRHEEQGAWF